MEPYEFKGDWEFEYQFEAFAGLQSRRGSYTSKDSKKENIGEVSVIVSDELNDDADPTEEQLNSINFIIDNPNKIKQALLNALEIEYPKLNPSWICSPQPGPITLIESKWMNVKHLMNLKSWRLLMKPGLTLFQQNAESLLKGSEFCCRKGSVNLKTGTGFVKKMACSLYLWQGLFKA